MKIAIINDIHLDYGGDFHKFSIRKFFNEKFFPYLLENNINNIIIPGDFFENKYSLQVKNLQFVNEVFLDKLKEYNLKCYISPGNHDLPYKHLASISTLQFIVANNPNVELCMKPKVLFDKILLVPWICQENNEEVLSFIDKSNCKFLIGHFEFAGFPFSKRGRINEEGMAVTNIFDKFLCVLSGHYHTKSISKNIMYLGTQYHLDENDISDKKYFHILDLEKDEIIPIENEYQLYKEIIFSNDDNYDEEFIQGFKDSIVRLIFNPEDYSKKYDLLKSSLEKVTFKVNVRFLKNTVSLTKKNLDDLKNVLKTDKEKLTEYVNLQETKLSKDILNKMLEKMWEKVPESK